MKLLFSSIYFLLIEFLRQPAYLVTTILFPSMFFWFFGLPNATSPEAAQMLMASFSAYGVLGVVLFQVCASFAQDRASGWSRYQRTLPVSPSLLLWARLSAAMLLSVVVVIGVLITAHAFADPEVPQSRWLSFLFAVFVGGVPFSALGLFLALASSPKAALPIANLVYLPLSFAGGLWMPPNALPKIVQDISLYLPTRFYGEWVWAAILGQEVAAKYIWGLLFYFILFFSAAIFLYRRDEGRRFG
jgi:ABC-2 type transport system permease protein